MRLTIDANADEMILAVRAAKKMAGTPGSKEALICYDDGSEFFVRRTKTGYTVKQVAFTNGER